MPLLEVGCGNWLRAFWSGDKPKAYLRRLGMPSLAGVAEVAMTEGVPNWIEVKLLFSQLK